jgi:DNA-binding IclR family transcriptional regulator
MQVGMGFFGSRTLLSAVELELFTHLGSDPLSGAAIGERLGLHPRAIPDFPDALVALGMLDREGDRLYQIWNNLTEGLKTGQPQNEIIQLAGPSSAAIAYKPE